MFDNKPPQINTGEKLESGPLSTQSAIDRISAKKKDTFALLDRNNFSNFADFAEDIEKQYNTSLDNIYELRDEYDKIAKEVDSDSTAYGEQKETKKGKYKIEFNKQIEDEAAKFITICNKIHKSIEIYQAKNN